MKDYYVLLTGTKNNAGDFLIKKQAIALLSKYRPDRRLIVLDAWKRFDTETLETVNKSQALLLTGGPSLQYSMYPKIYPLIDNLDLISVPILTMGIGWKSPSGSWKDTYDYPLSSKTESLIKKIAVSGFLSSVRDFHTLNVLSTKGYDQFLMTGCPAYYNLQSFNSPFDTNKKMDKIAFSLGVTFFKSKAMERQVKEIIQSLRDTFSEKDFEVVFHHSLDEKEYMSSHNANRRLWEAHKEMEEWLKEHQVNYVDISGSAENMINYYSSVDFHIGYRVHAHIYMNSMSKFSILIAEDGRATATEKVIGGIVLQGIEKYRNSLLERVTRKVFNAYDLYKANPFIIEEIESNRHYEEKIQFNRVDAARERIRKNFEVMELYLKQLP